MEPSGKPKDLIPESSGHRHLSAPKQKALTPEAAESILRPQGRPAEEEEDPITKGRGNLEMIFYGIMLLVVVGYQLFSYLDTASDGRLAENPQVVAVEVLDEVRGEEYRVEGNRLEKPHCEQGTAKIEVGIAEVDGQIVGNLELGSESRNGEWLIQPRSLPLGGAEITARARLYCEETS